jgi:ribonucleotide monophosphatase NagD (HAD superfamily)
VFDLDGTLYLGDELLPGAHRLIAELRERDRPIRFISNNPTREPDQYAEKLALGAAGIRMSSQPDEIDIVIASYDRAFDYAKLRIAFDAIWFHKRATLIATNPDRFCPLPGGRGEPDCAAITAAIEACTQTTATGRRSSLTGSIGCCQRPSGRNWGGVSPLRR